MKTTLINYYISENYIPHWSLEDAYREIHQNFKDYGLHNIEILNVEKQPDLDIVIISNSFKPDSTDLLIIGESNKNDKQIGKYGEGLKMAALVILRNKGALKINSDKFSANFILIENDTTSIKTLGVDIREYSRDIPLFDKDNSFQVELILPAGSFKEYQESIITPIDAIHTRENYGSIVNKPKGNLYVGDLYVCNISKLITLIIFILEFVI